MDVDNPVGARAGSHAAFELTLLTDSAKLASNARY